MTYNVFSGTLNPTHPTHPDTYMRAPDPLLYNRVVGNNGHTRCKPCVGGVHALDA